MRGAVAAIMVTTVLGTVNISVTARPASGVTRRQILTVTMDGPDGQATSDRIMPEEIEIGNAEQAAALAILAIQEAFPRAVTVRRGCQCRGGRPRRPYVA